VTVNEVEFVIPRVLGSRAGLTVVRTIGELIVSNSGSGTSEDWIAAIAAGDFAAGVPSPQDGTYPWMWTHGGATDVTNVITRIPIDVRAKRRFTDGDASMFLTIRNNDGVNSMLFRFVIRCYWLVP